MKFSAETISSGEVLIPSRNEEQLFRRHRAQELTKECKRYIAGLTVSEELLERIEALKIQDRSLSSFGAVEVLLDYAEREQRECEAIEKGQYGFFHALKIWVKSFFL